MFPAFFDNHIFHLFLYLIFAAFGPGYTRVCVRASMKCTAISYYFISLKRRVGVPYRCVRCTFCPSLNRSNCKTESLSLFDSFHYILMSKSSLHYFIHNRRRSGENTHCTRDTKNCALYLLAFNFVGLLTCPLSVTSPCHSPH
jgi:hypothetical protein